MGGFYNMVHGYNTQGVMALSLFINKRVDEFFPRFRDVFTKDNDCPVKDYDFIVYTRMGGPNSRCLNSTTHSCECMACISRRIEDEDYVVARYDDKEDNTYTNFVIKLTDEMHNISKEEFDARYEALWGDLMRRVEAARKVVELEE